MIDVYLEADGQQLRVTHRPDVIVAGTRGLLRLNFKLSADWLGCSVAADFGTDAAPVAGGQCRVPDSVAGLREIPVRLVGRRGRERMCSGTVKISQRME